MPDRTLSIAGEAPGTSAAVREWNRQLQRIDRLQTQLAELQALGQRHRQALQMATEPTRAALNQVRQGLASRLAEALDLQALATLRQTPGLQLHALGAAEREALRRHLRPVVDGFGRSVGAGLLRDVQRAIQTG